MGKGPLGLWILAAALLLSACGESRQDAVAPPSASQQEFQKNLIKQLVTAKPGQVIELPAGTFALTRGLTLNADGVTLRGQGMDKTILSFKNQVQGAEGLLVNASDFTIEDLAIEDAKGDGLKVNEGKNIVIRRVRTEWTSGPAESNGAYGIYPVQTENVLIEESVAIAASDAGIYVGQSHNVVVRNNRAEFNVAGIEIENTIGADVYDNLARNNTGGILVFNMPNLPQPGYATRVYQNRIVANNTKNFAPEGTAVSSVPAGSGVVINSNDQVEIFDNEIADNQTANIIISSYFSAGYASEKSTAPDFDPYPETIYIYGNRFSGGGDKPDMLELKALKLAQYGLGGRLPDILWDGVVNPAKADASGHLKPEYAICIDNGDAGIINIDAGNNYANIRTDASQHQCQHDKLAPIELSLGAQ